MSHKFSKKKKTRMSFPVFLVRGKKPDEEHADPQSWRISVTPPSFPGLALPEQQPGQKQSLETKVISRNQQTVWCMACGDSRMFLLNIIQSRVCSDECSLHDIGVLQQHHFFFWVREVETQRKTVLWQTLKWDCTYIRGWGYTVHTRLQPINPHSSSTEVHTKTWANAELCDQAYVYPLAHICCGTQGMPVCEDTETQRAPIKALKAPLFPLH